MKHSTILALVIIISSSGHAKELCKVKRVESTGTLNIYPIYKTSVSYTFDSYERKALSQVRWDYDRDATSICANKVLAENPNAKIEIIGPNMPDLEFTVKGGLKKGPMMVYSEQGGQFHGNTDLIPVDYQLKSEIISSIKKKEALISHSSDLKFEIEEIRRDVVGEFNCSKGSSKKGILALHSRLSDLLAKIKTFNPTQRVDSESVLENFLGTCVEIKDGESKDFKGLARKVSLLDSKLPIYGDTISYSTEIISPIENVESSYMEF